MDIYQSQRSYAAIRSATARRVKKVIGLIDELADAERFELNNGEMWDLLASVRYLASNSGTDPMDEDRYQHIIERKQWLAQREAEKQAEAEAEAADLQDDDDDTVPL